MTIFDASITGDELDSAVQLPNVRLVAAMPHGTQRAYYYSIYSTRLALFIHGITSAKRTHEVQPVALVGESSTQLLMYSLDTGVRYSTYLPYPI